MTSRLPLALALAISPLVLLSTSLPAPGQMSDEEPVYRRIEELHGDSAGFIDAAALLQRSMQYRDAATVAGLGVYPMVVEANAEVYDILEARDLEENFDRLISPDLSDEIANFALTDLIVNSDGVGFANGGLWMANVCLDAACARTRWAISRVNEVSYDTGGNTNPGDDMGSGPALPVAAGSWGGRVRSGPGKEFSQIASLAEGAPVTLLEMTEYWENDYPWFRIQMENGTVGYQWGGILCGVGTLVEGTYEICD